MTDINVDTARELLKAGVAELDVDNDDPEQWLPVHAEAEVEHATAKAVLFIRGSIEHWVPKQALRVDEPESLVAHWFVELNKEWEIVA